MNRRRYLAATGVAAAGALAGCLDRLLGDRTSFAAEPAAVDEATLEATGYVLHHIEDLTVEEGFEAGGESVTVEVTNWVTQYEKTVEFQPLGSARAAIFAVLTSPEVTVLDQQFNPVEDMEPAELMELVQENYDDIEDVRHVEDVDAEVLGQSTTEGVFEASGQFQGFQVPVDLHVTQAVARGDDFVVTIGAYPELIRGQERPNVRDLAANVVPDVPEDHEEEAAADEGDGNGDADDPDGEDDADDGGGIDLGLGDGAGLWDDDDDTGSDGIGLGLPI